MAPCSENEITYPKYLIHSYFRLRNILNIFAMKQSLFLLSIPLFFALSSCCDDHEGYGRYTLGVGCGSVTIDGTVYELTKRGSDYVIDGHSISRGIYRKTRPWLYTHQVNTTSDKVTLTFDTGDKPMYPLYTGSTGSIFAPFDRAWDIGQSTCVAFSDNYWLVFHRFTEDGVLVDLQLNMEPETNERWRLVSPDVLISTDGSSTHIDEINASVSIADFDLGAKTCRATFTAD